MSNKEAEKKALLQASDYYYNSPEKMSMSNEEYDARRKAYEEKYKESLPVGSAPEIGTELTLSHSYADFAGTLSKCKDISELKEWIRVKGIKGKQYWMSMKADGFSIVVEYVFSKGMDDAVVSKALTRGQDGVGKDLTNLFKANHSVLPIPTSINEDFAVGYELVITYEDFDKLNEELIASKKPPYKNPRNAVSGLISNTAKHLFSKYATLIPLRIKLKNGHLPRKEQIRIISEEMNYDYFFNSPMSSIEFQYETIEKLRFENDRSEIPFMVDGLVIEAMDEDQRLELGYTTSEPNFATALKFTPAEKATKVVDIKWSAEGYSAKFTPIVHFEPVLLDGKTYTKVSLANYARFLQLSLKKNDDILFELRHDTLGYVSELNTEHNKNSKEKAFQVPTKCPCCKADLVTDDVFLYCINADCQLNLIGDIQCFIEKIGVKNIGREMITSLVENTLLTSVEDIFKLDYKKVAKLDGFGEVSAKNIKMELDKVFSKEVNADTFLGSLNIYLFGRGKARIILKKHTCEELFNMYAEEKLYDLVNIDGVSFETVKSIKEGFDNKSDTINELLEHITLKDIKVETKADFKELKICHTGSAKPFAKRDELKELIESKGHKFVSDVSKATDILVNNDVTSTSGKNKKAQELGIEILSVEDLVKRIS